MTDVAEKNIAKKNTAKENQLNWPLSAAQKGIWLGQQLNPQSAIYNTAECLELIGDLDPVLFERAVRQMVAEAETLNLCFTVADQSPVQSVAENLKWRLTHLDLSGDDHAEQAAWNWMRQDLSQQTHLGANPLFAQALIRVASDRHFWYQRIHHIAIDGYGSSLLLRRAAEIYTRLKQRQPVSLSPFASLRAVIEEDIVYQKSEQKARDRSFWLQALEGAPEPVSLSCKPMPASDVCLRQKSALPSEVFQQLKTVAQQNGAAWSDLLLAVTAVYLHQATSADDLTLGVPMMGRLGSASLRVPAMVMNIVPLRVLISPDICFLELVEPIRQQLRSIRPHSRYRYEQLRRDLKRVGGGRRLFGPIVNIMPFDYAIHFGETAGIVHNISAGPVEDIAINFRAQAGGKRLTLELDANPDCYSLNELTQHQQNWLATLHSVLNHPKQVISAAQLVTRTGITALNATELHNTELHNSQRDSSQRSIISQRNIIRGEPLLSTPQPVLTRLIEQVSLRPHSTAIVASEVSMSYCELLAAAHNLAVRLTNAGVKPGQIVAIYLPRSWEAIITILGVLFSGAGYLALDPTAPVARNSHLLKDAQPALLITTSEYQPHSISGLPPTILLNPLEYLPTTDLSMAEVVTSDLSTIPAQNSPAYVVYTSGSTGVPKGLVIDHRALSNFVSGALQRYKIQPEDRVLQFASLHFDASVEEIFLTLCSGATLVLREESMLQSLPHFLKVCQQKDISILDLPTAFWHELAFCLSNHQESLPTSLRMVIIGGEAAQSERIKQWHSVVGNEVRLLNTYGPSEATVVATVATLEPGCVDQGKVPIGRPLPGIDIAVINAAGYPATPGQRGELCILGPTLAKEYLGKSQLTADCFVCLHQLPGKPRAYRTGDQVFIRPDGQLVFTGRLDAEFKISGHRINPAEIESVLLTIPGIREAAVVGHHLPEGIKRLCAYLVAKAPHPPVRTLRQHLSERLPAAVIPAGFNFLEALPKTLSGKVDRTALHSCSPKWITQRENAASSLEAVILRTWEDILGQQGLTVQDDFFELGGQSLQTIQATNWLSTKLDREISVSTIFRHPTAAALAKALNSDISSSEVEGAGGRQFLSTGSSTGDTLFSPLFPITEGNQPLFCIHPAAGISWCYMSLAKHLGAQHSLYGLQSPYLDAGALALESLSQGISKDSWEQMMERYLAMIRQVQPEGSYRLLGWSFGGMVAQAIATQLQQQGNNIEQLILLDAYPGHCIKRRDRHSEQEVLELLRQATGQASLPSKQIAGKEDNNRPQQLQSNLGSHLDLLRQNTLLDITRYNIQMAQQAPTPDPYNGNLIFFTASHGRTDATLTHRQWQPFVTGSIKNYNIDTTHGQLLTGEYSQIIARAIAAHLEA
ncbi:amino acid adenylation domain protein [Synechococcus sp. PCC 7335]|uniref:non-ribosomal peptide synthetase n=1 Tax=Synechococcus sp. (strain ATCC 29403 / PCC 7335) TaxID=91464 RepID=UPI00017ED203|nr:non-ribosomal peptide synthetase [Synechococcus sp. PCC 7335]EDX86939.1 amino acid adenylation domain protein [Synechococcus sp. PCC 7335]